MRITVEQAAGRRIVIPIPAALAYGPLGAKAVSAAVQRSTEAALTYAQARELLRQVRASRSAMGDLPLLEVTDADGTHIRIDI